MPLKPRHRPAIPLALAALLLATPALGQSILRMGISAAPGSVDPHFNQGTSTQTLTYHVFETLTDRRPDSSLAPGLALSWKPVADDVWEFRLRPGVRFSDGQPFTADDVAFTIARVPKVPNATASYAGQTRSIRRVEVVDPLTVRFHTDGPSPNLPIDLAVVGIVSRHAGEGATTEDYNALKAAIGTGPFILRSFVPGTEAKLERNPGWWGPKPDWDAVEFRYIANPGARSAALLSGGVDLIDLPSPNDLPRFRNDPGISLFSTQGLRLVYLAPNQAAEVAPFITGNDGQPLPRNPLRDQRVRRALSVAINRTGLTERVMQGTAEPNGQFMPRGTYSYNPGIPVPPYDPALARKLLAEAGYPDGFRMTLHVAQNARPTDPVSAQAIAQMWTRAGVQTEVETMPLSAYSPRAAKMEFAATMWGWASPGHAGHPLISVLSSYNREQLTGSFNREGYSNPALDALVQRAVTTLDDGARERLFREAMAMAMEDVAVIPLYQLTNIWATRKGITYEASGYDYTRAVLAHQAR
ncbi:ABC transporter substrate-binding protein [Roseomonas sp. E05]|uniref:ABC transporter substrate-binding protein n=1 Tax=Roseomonas sp. E05 TaxID=3046310 RepID=UPI0024B90763|nr:ABC transporter substrate-binding protein [Roseomonas sp. E05]MDJ0389067.1 ABC transporter substrate-binding protein [Roseomonas sp. E05]